MAQGARGAARCNSHSSAGFFLLLSFFFCFYPVFVVSSLHLSLSCSHPISNNNYSGAIFEEGALTESPPKGENVSGLWGGAQLARDFSKPPFPCMWPRRPAARASYTKGLILLALRGNPRSDKTIYFYY